MIRLRKWDNSPTLGRHKTSSDRFPLGGGINPKTRMAATSTAIALEDHSPDQEQRNVAASSRNEDESFVYKCLLIFAGFMAMFQVIGVNSSYGVFEQYYLSNESFLPSGTSPAAVAFVGTLGLHRSSQTELSRRLVGPMLGFRYFHQSSDGKTKELPDNTLCGRNNYVFWLDA